MSRGQSVEPTLTRVPRRRSRVACWIELAVFERELGHIRAGDRGGDLAARRRGQLAVQGSVAHVGDVIDLRDAQTATVRVVVEQPDGSAAPGAVGAGEDPHPAPAARDRWSCRATRSPASTASRRCSSRTTRLRSSRARSRSARKTATRVEVPTGSTPASASRSAACSRSSRRSFASHARARSSRNLDSFQMA